MAQRDVFAFDTKKLDMAPAARRFEGGSPSIPNIFAARPGLALLTEIGMQNVADQIAHLTRNFMQGTRALGIAAKTPDTSAGPLVVLRSTDPSALVGKLAAKGVMVSARQDGVRFSFHVYNNLDDVNMALSVLQANLHLLART